MACRREGTKVEGGMTFNLSTYRARILPSRPLTEQIDPGAQLSQYYPLIQFILNIGFLMRYQWQFFTLPL